ncbi:phage holin family protein [Candidatus Gottesmanbacteria bacterium]|nr:phage holin family protein [Candidatus Gottesmanbacteria bacterium]
MATARSPSTFMFSKLGLALLFALLAPSVYAVTVSIGNVPTNIDQSQEFDVDVFLSCASCGDSYLRGAFYPGGTNYFGFTQNNQGRWIGTVSDKTQYFKVAESELLEGSWSGKLKVKSDPEDSAYSGSGNYYFKVGRYTAGGSATWSNEVSLAISGPTPTPTNTPTKTPTQAPQSTSAPTPTKKLTPTKTPTPKISLTPTATAAAVLGAEVTVASSTATVSGGLKQVLPLIVALLLVAIGLAIIAGVLVWKKRKLT